MAQRVDLNKREGIYLYRNKRRLCFLSCRFASEPKVVIDLNFFSSMVAMRFFFSDVHLHIVGNGLKKN
jgi:hypothetical protein